MACWMSGAWSNGTIVEVPVLVRFLSKISDLPQFSA